MTALDERKRRAFQSAIDTVTASGACGAAALVALLLWPDQAGYARILTIAAVFTAARCWWHLRTFIALFEQPDQR
jgi:hypothetical protein